MDSSIVNKNNDEVEKMSRTLWVGNLHPKVSNENVAELFYQVIKVNSFYFIILLT